MHIRHLIEGNQYNFINIPFQIFSTNLYLIGIGYFLSALGLVFFVNQSANEPPHDKTNKMICAPSEDSDQLGHPPSLIRVFAVRSVGSL